MDIYTIGFTQKSAKDFFELLKANSIRRLIDVRLNNSSQLSGFSKMRDLEYFLGVICDAEYLHMPMLAPTQEMRDQYRAVKNGWDEYARQYLELMREREIENKLDKSLFDERTVFLCTEPIQQHCHRRLLVEYLNSTWGNVSSIPL